MSEEESHQQGASAVAPVERQKSPATLRRDKYRYTLTAADDEFILEMIENHKPMVFIADMPRKGWQDVNRAPTDA